MLSPMVGYAVTALGYIASGNGRPMRVKDIADAMRIPAPYLAKIMHRLSRRGCVVTRRGLGGGVTLRRDPRELTLLDVCEALEDPILSPRCMLGGSLCTDDVACPAHEFSRVANAELFDFLGRTTLLEVARFNLERAAPERAAPERAAPKRAARVRARPSDRGGAKATRRRSRRRMGA
jgi:Rrf2 family protein